MTRNRIWASHELGTALKQTWIHIDGIGHSIHSSLRKPEPLGLGDRSMDRSEYSVIKLFRCCVQALPVGCHRVAVELTACEGTVVEHKFSDKGYLVKVHRYHCPMKWANGIDRAAELPRSFFLALHSLHSLHSQPLPSPSLASTEVHTTSSSGIILYSLFEI